MNANNKLKKKRMKFIIIMMISVVFFIGQIFSPFAISANADPNKWNSDSNGNGKSTINAFVVDRQGNFIKNATVTFDHKGKPNDPITTRTSDSNGSLGNLILDNGKTDISVEGYNEGDYSPSDFIPNNIVQSSLLPSKITPDESTLYIVLNKINIDTTVPTTELTISVNDSSNQSIPQYTNSGGKSDTIFNSPIRLAADATAKISYNFTNAPTAKYQFIQASNVNTLPQFPQDSTMTNINLSAPNSEAAYGNDIDKQGYVNTKHYVYAGKAGEELSRDISFGTPISDGVLVQQAIPAKDIYETQGTGSNAFLLDIKNNNVAYSNPKNKNAAKKAMKLWGYFSPQRTGSYLLGAYSDDGAYGYIMVNGVKQVFVHDWRIAPPQFRATPAGTSIDTQVKTSRKYTGINLEKGKYYPIYMEWYEGQSSQAAFVPQYLYNSNLNYQFTIPNDINSGNSTTNIINYAIPSTELYSSKTTTPGEVAGAYFGDVSGIPFPNDDGTYYMATKFVSGESETSGLYGPFIIDKTPPTISKLSVTSNNSSSNKNAVAGNTLTINFTASEALQGNPQILINGYVANVTYTSISGNNYTATVNIGKDNSINSSGDKITNGPITVQIAHYSDLSGNVGSPVQDNSVTFISNNLGITLALTQNQPDINGNVVVTANATAYGYGNSIKTMKYASGNQSLNYFSAGGASLTINSLPSSNNSNGILQSPVQSTFNVNTNGVYTVYATDSSGNVAVQTINVSNIDTTAPTTPTITVTPTGWTNQTVSFTISGSTDSGSEVQKYQYQIDNGNWTDYSAAVTISTEGNHIINARAVDNAGNISEIATASGQIDTTAPTKPTITVNPTGWTNQTVSFTISGSTDSASGVQKYQYQIDNGSWTDYSASVIISTEGNHIINARAVDNAGNISEIATANAQIDKTAPTLELYKTPITLTNEDVTINVTATDNVGIDTTKWLAGTRTVSDFTSAGTVFSGNSFTVSSNGTYTVYTVDIAGNAVVKTITVSNIYAKVQGIVTDHETNNPISGATVSVKNANGETISSRTTDSNGEYTLNIETPADSLQVTITASADGYSAESYTQTLVGGVDANEQNFSLSPYELPSINLSQSPDAGTYTNGDVTITATGAAGTNPVKDIILPNGTIVNGSSAQYQVSSNGVYTFIVEDTEGRTSQATITINNIYAKVQGTVTDVATNNPISGAVVAVKNANGETISSGITGSDGKYTFNNIVAPAAGVQVTIEASADDYRTQSFPKTLVGRVNVYEQNFSLTSTFEASLIEAHGIYGGNEAAIADGNEATKDIPVTMAMVVNARSSHPVINWSVDDNTKITVDNNSFKGYEISKDGKIGSPVPLTIDGNGNITGITMQKDKKYLIVYTITPTATGTITLTATADGTSSEDGSVTLNVGAIPDLF